MEAVISASKFLDLLNCVIPAVSSDDTRPYLCCVKLEIISNEYAIRAIATDGHILSVSQRNLGFSDSEQNDFEDIEAKEKVKNATWLISKVDAEIIIGSLKKLGVKQSETQESRKYYIVIKEIKKDEESRERLSISILGMSHLVLEPEVIYQEFPDYQKVIPTNNWDNVESIAFNLDSLKTVAKCWGFEMVYMSFFNGGAITKIIRKTEEEEKQKDLIVLMTLARREDDEKKIKSHQFSFFDND